MFLLFLFQVTRCTCFWPLPSTSQKRTCLHLTLHVTPTSWNVGNSTAAHDVGAELPCPISSESAGGVSFGALSYASDDSVQQCNSVTFPEMHADYDVPGSSLESSLTFSVAAKSQTTEDD